MSLAVVIPTRNPDNLAASSAAVREHEPSAMIVVVDDGLAKRPPACVLVPGEKPFIYARNCNLGIRTALRDGTCRGVVLLNDDAILESPGGFTLLAEACDADPTIGIIGCTTNVTGQRLQWRMDEGLREVPEIAFVGVYIPRQTLASVGLLDERYALDYGCEDKDYCMAVKRAGLRVCVHDGCYLDHGSLVSTFLGDPRAPKSFAQNLELFRQKWGTVHV